MIDDHLLVRSGAFAGCASPGVPSEPSVELDGGTGADGCSGSLALALRRGMRADTNFVIDDHLLVRSGAFVGCASPGVPSEPSVELEGGFGSDGCSGPAPLALRRRMSARMINTRTSAAPPNMPIRTKEDPPPRRGETISMKEAGGSASSSGSQPTSGWPSLTLNSVSPNVAVLSS